MKKPILLFAAIIAALVVAFAFCAKNNGSAVDDSENKATSLTQEELEYFNGTQFFNRHYESMVIDSINIRNQFLSSEYENPKDIDLFQLFYCGSGIEESVADEELFAVEKMNGKSFADEEGWICPCTKISAEAMDKVLLENTGLTLDEINKISLDKFTFLEEYNAYYYFHGDSNYRGDIAFHSGERQGDTIRPYYNDTFFGDGEKVLTLRQQKGGTYWFVSNLKE